MPGVNPPNNERLLQVIGSHEQRLRAMETQQQRTITNSLGEPLLNFGLVPGSDPAAYGLQFVDPATGSEQMFIGENDSGTGVNITITGTGKITVEDDNGNEAVTLGKLSDGSYGLSVTDSAGVTMPLSQLAFGLTVASEASPFSMSGSAGTWQSDDNSTTFSLHSGRCVVVVSASITVGASNDPLGFNCYYGYTLSGPSDIGTSTDRAIDVFAQQNTTRLGMMFIHTGLAAGDYTINGAVMRTTGTSGDSLPSASAALRSLIVLPY